MTAVSPISRAWQLFRPQRRDLWVVAVYAAGSGLLSLAIPVGVQSMVNTVGFGQSLQPVVVLGFLVLVGLGFSAALRGFQTFAVEILQQQLFARAALRTAERLPRLRSDTVDAHHAPELVNRFFEILTVQKSAATLLLDGVALVLLTVVGLGVMAAYHPLLLGFGVVLALSVVAVLWGGGRRGLRTAVAESIAKYRLAAWLGELARHQATFKSAAGQRLAIGRAEGLIRGWVTARREHFAVLLRQLVGTLGLQVLTSAGLLVVGGELVLQRQLTLGQLVAAELIVSAVMAGVAKSAKYVEALYDLLAAADKLGVLDDLPIEPQRTAQARGPDHPLAVTARGLQYGYARQKRPVFSSLDLDIQAGEHVVVLGARGSGKSTLAELLFAARKPDEGTLDLDGIDVRDWPLDELRRRVALARPAELFAGTVAENLDLGQGHRVEDMRAVLEAVGLWEEVARRADGLDTVITTHGASLSRLEAERLVLARALLARPGLLLVDGLQPLSPAEWSTLDAWWGGSRPTILWFANEAGTAAVTPLARVLTLGAEVSR